MIRISRLAVHRILIGIAVLALGLAAGGCGGGAEEPAAEPTATEREREAPAAGSAGDAGAEAGGISDAARAQAKQIFQTRCFTCHGMEGKGDGPGSAGLSPKPRDFHDPEWQESVSDEHIQNIILYGGAAVGKSPTMPGNPDLTAKPEVVAALVDHIRDFGDTQ